LDLNVTDQWSVWVMGGYKSADDYYNLDRTYGDRFVRLSENTTIGYKVRGNLTKFGIYRQINSIYGDWGGDWSVWGGTTFKFNKKTSFNAQVSYDDTDTFAASINVKYELVPGLVITPELTYVSWDNDYSIRNEANTIKAVDSLKGQDAFQGMVRIQRSF
ncbi:porin, partial [uncultured Bartonella sp.]|uniref:porin n=1 Tax=uncultured Bartonella sp. TaxID=104108 RepID=UPI0026076A09